MSRKYFRAKGCYVYSTNWLQKRMLCVFYQHCSTNVFHLVPMLLFAKGKIGSNFFRCWKSRGIVVSEAVNAIVIVVSPLNSLMSNQIPQLNLSGIPVCPFRERELRTARRKYGRR